MVREIIVSLPEPLATEAEQSGLLRSEVLERLLREEVRRLRVGRLFSTVDRLSALGVPPLTLSEIEAEIQATRAEKRDAGRP
jgi:hypothetical protein